MPPCGGGSPIVENVCFAFGRCLYSGGREETHTEETMETAILYLAIITFWISLAIAYLTLTEDA